METALPPIGCDRVQVVLDGPATYESELRHNEMPTEHGGQENIKISWIMEVKKSCISTLWLAEYRTAYEVRVDGVMAGCSSLMAASMRKEAAA
ncbi:unnamed protein product [Angiostrongylus costaricensis]|uniref:Uncharacterized protein n=1 Tax=Angiostrongylus costaricensis TaxID=334426 RepID=A0A0R3PL30_ANGCS|nr:unnamed protein product [Angiostrongylus costaricensis]